MLAFTLLLAAGNIDAATGIIILKWHRTPPHARVYHTLSFGASRMPARRAKNTGYPVGVFYIKISNISFNIVRILQYGKRCHAGEYRYYPYWHVAYDTGAGSHKTLVTDL